MDFNRAEPIISDREHFLNTGPSDLSIVGTCDILFTECTAK